MSIYTAVRLPDELSKRLATLAKRTDRPRSYYIRQALELHIDELEDTYLAENTLERIRRGEEPTYALNEVEREIGLINKDHPRSNETTR